MENPDTKKKMKKSVKVTLWVVGGLFAFLFVAFLSHPLWVGPLGAGVARSIVPDMTKSEFQMDSLCVNLYSGKVCVDGVAVRNPGKAANDVPAISLKSLSVKFGTMSMISDEKHIEEIVVDGFRIYGDMTFSNLRQIVANINEYIGETPEEPEKEPAKVVIDRLFITGTVFKWGVVEVPLPDIELKDIGKEEETTGEGVFDEVVTAVCDAADKVAVGSGKALKLAIEGGNKLAEGVKAVTGAVGEAAGKAGEIGGAAIDKAGEIGGAAVDKAGEIGGAAVDGVKKGLDGIKNLNPFK